MELFLDASEANGSDDSMEAWGPQGTKRPGAGPDVSSRQGAAAVAAAVTSAKRHRMEASFTMTSE
jgi:hypothetical protein